MRRTVTILVAIGCFLATASTARAFTAPIGAVEVTQTPVMQETLNAALWYWHEAPQCGMGLFEGVHVYTASIPQPAVAEAEQPGCRILLSPEGWAWLNSTEPENRLAACDVVTHEFGHLLGHGHVDDPHNVMHAELVNLDTVAGCIAWSKGEPPLSAVTVQAKKHGEAKAAPRHHRRRHHR